MPSVTKGALVEYTTALPPLVLVFEFNPQTLSRTRTITIRGDNVPGHRGYEFASPADVPRIAQGASVQPESFSVEILIDATESLMNGDSIAEQFGIEPELDTLRSMVEPKSQGPTGMQRLASLGLSRERAFRRAQSPSVLLFVWGTHVLPVFLTSVRVDERAHLASLHPYRANVNLDLQVIEGRNPFYVAEQLRQLGGAGLSSSQAVGLPVGGLR